MGLYGYFVILIIKTPDFIYIVIEPCKTFVAQNIQKLPETSTPIVILSFIFFFLFHFREILDTKEPNNVRIANDEKVELKDNSDNEVFEEQAPVVKEGKDFHNELPDRLYLDSDPEFHLNMHIVFSYLLLFHVDSHILMVVRRVTALYLVWLIIGFGVFVYTTYYPVLLDELIPAYLFNNMVNLVYKE